MENTVKPKIAYKKAPDKKPLEKIRKKPGPKKGTPHPRKGMPRKMTEAIIANPGGRPSQFEEAAPKIISYIRKGNTYECAAGCSRVTYTTFNNWIKQGKDDLEEGKLDSKYLKFFIEVQQAERDCEEEVLGYWRQEMPGNWQACKEYLSRRHHSSWGSKDKVDVTSNGESIGKEIFLPLKRDDEKEE